MKIKFLAAAACLALVTAASASAATLNFSNNGVDASTINFRHVSVSASSTGFVNLGAPVVNQTSNGLGVRSFFDMRGGQVDGLFGTETLTFVFNQVVTLTGITFGAFDSRGGFFNPPDSYGLSLNGGATSELNENPWSGSEVLSTFSLTASNGSDWRVTSVSYEISAVPLPAGAVLLLSGLAAFGFARRRKAALGIAADRVV